MEIFGWVVLGIVVAVAFLVIVIYNRLVALRQSRHNAFSDIDVQLNLRYDLVPNLVNTVQGYASHEREVFTKVTEARAKAMGHGGDDEARLKAEGRLSQAMMELMAVAENYPDLKADGNFRQLQTELSDIENKIAAARRYFNSATSELNTAVQSFPAVLFAGMFGFTQQPFFELEAATEAQVRQAPKVQF